MSTDRDTSRIVRSWLEEGVTALPDRVLDAVLDQVPATHQRRLWWPAWRSNHMRRAIPFLIAAAAVLIVAVVGVNLLPGRATVGGPATPTPSIPATPSSGAVAPSPSDLAGFAPGPLTAGIYQYTGQATQIPFKVTVPAGWSLDVQDVIFKGGDIWSGAGAALLTWPIDHVYSNACKWRGTLVPTNGGAALVTALAGQKGHAVSAPTQVLLGGRAATKLEFSLASGFDAAACDGGIVHLWPQPGPDESAGWNLFPGQMVTVWVLDSGPNRLPMTLLAVRNETTPAADAADLQTMVDSVQFEP